MSIPPKLVRKKNLTNPDQTLIAAHLAYLEPLGAASQARLDRDGDEKLTAVDLALTKRGLTPDPAPLVTAPLACARAGGSIKIIVAEKIISEEWIATIEAGSAWVRTQLKSVGSTLKVPVTSAPPEGSSPIPAHLWLRTKTSLPALVPFTLCPGPMIFSIVADGDEALLLRVEGLPKSDADIRVKHNRRIVDFTRTAIDTLRVNLCSQDRSGSFIVMVGKTISNLAVPPPRPSSLK
jgi:hypothetical protein